MTKLEEYIRNKSIKYSQEITDRPFHYYMNTIEDFKNGAYFLKPHLEAMEKALAFYENETNWYNINRNRPRIPDDAPEIKIVISTDDIISGRVAGYTARMALEAYREAIK